MPKKTTSTRAFVIGLTGGSRAATPLAALALAHGRKDMAGPWQQWWLFRSPVGRGLLVAAAVGELVGDKLPATPSRIAFPGILGRIASGAVAGAALGSLEHSRTGAGAGAVLGGIGALLGSFAGFGLRALLGKQLPDPVVALAEDAAAITGATRAVTDR